MAPQTAPATPATPSPSKLAKKREKAAAAAKEWFQNAGPVTQTEMRNPEGLVLYGHHWVVPDARAKVVLCHGYGMHARFDYLRHDPENLKSPPVYEGSWVHKLNNAQCSVHCLDQQSFGLSEGHKGKKSHILDMEDLPRDTLQFLYEQVLPSQDPNLPIFICGISLGGCITARVVQLAGGGPSCKKSNKVAASGEGAPEKRPLPLRGAICMAPLFRMDRLKKKNKRLLPLARALSAIVPSLEVGKPAKNQMYPFFHDLIEIDPLCYTGKSRARLSHELLRVVETVQTQAPFLAFPEPAVKTKDSPLPYPFYVPETPSLLIVHSKNDTFVDPEGSVIVAATLGAKMDGSQETLEKYQAEYDNVAKSGNVVNHPDANMWLLDNMWHCLSKELPEGDLLMDRVIRDWLRPRMGAGPDAKAMKEAKEEKEQKKEVQEETPEKPTGKEEAPSGSQEGEAASKDAPVTEGESAPAEPQEAPAGQLESPPQAVESSPPDVPAQSEAEPQEQQDTAPNHREPATPEPQQATPAPVSQAATPQPEASASGAEQSKTPDPESRAGDAEGAGAAASGDNVQQDAADGEAPVPRGPMESHSDVNL
ncbi:lysophospholipase, related [Neospora caninum Liverpool]|uniref:Lysophospholipase, related n=1 Tax=Neospora caninum (strain Liverpool) TaxID=572307 RepID=F0VB57_NEOCL|nr:lysophospholipase, related [Neospora caninum Liverpool]CBZ51394.1 lysophospholipase, related [Neospora caninum Liverpool]CEL68714.1 TPA: Lysophospholipase, related [Neospora caninum Liverpool]|eukprot:XP_003881427.1 lysophospholipase, related [Neospora caninum Liverpool]